MNKETFHFKKCVQQICVWEESLKDQTKGLNKQFEMVYVMHNVLLFDREMVYVMHNVLLFHRETLKSNYSHATEFENLNKFVKIVQSILGFQKQDFRFSNSAGIYLIQIEGI